MEKKSVAMLALILALAGGAQALETREIVALAAMPLAVAAVSELTDVPTADLMSLVGTLNQAAVPPTQFVEVVRYSPIAFADTSEPRFVEYVTTQYESGLVGEPLAVSIVDRYETYGVEEIDFNSSSSTITIVEEREILPPMVVTRFRPVEFDPVALVAMPLAVAAVADLADVPRSDLISMIMSLNRAYVPAPQFVEVVRYSPVVLIDRDASPRFLAFVNTEVDRGVIGRPLAFAIGDRFRLAGIQEINVVSPPPVFLVERPDVAPVFTLPRIVETRSHPHGGPPGQLKKQLGLQTGAEVVHGTRSRTVAKPRPTGDRDRVRVERVEKRPPPKRVAQPPVRKQVQKAPKVREEQRAPKHSASRNDGGGQGAKPAKGGGNSGKGKGKGKGKG